MKVLDLSVNLFRRYEQVREVNAYYGLMALYGLVKTAEINGDPWTLTLAQRYLARYPDGMKHPRYNFENYRVGGNPQMYAHLAGLITGKEELLRLYAEETLRAPADRDGILCMPRSPEKEQIWIDVVVPATIYMLYAGLFFKEPRYIDFAIDQCFKMYDVFENPENGLLHQCRGFLPDATAFSTDHWSRGNGWGYIGLTDLIAFLPKDHPQYAEVERRFVKHSEAMLPWQTDRGLWRQELVEPLSWEESSGTGLILYGYGVGLRMGVLDPARFMPAFRLGLDGLVRYCINADFSTERSCPGCLCAGYGAMKGTPQGYIVDKTAFRNEPHSFGPFMLTLVEAHLNGITDVAWEK